MKRRFTFTQIVILVIIGMIMIIMPGLCWNDIMQDFSLMKDLVIIEGVGFLLICSVLEMSDIDCFVSANLMKRKTKPLPTEKINK